MAKEPKVYTRLTKSVAGFGSYSSLWLAADHVLIARSNGYNEDYVRVQLCDIKGIFLSASSRRLWWALTWAIFTAPAAIVLTVRLLREEMPIWSLIFTGIGILALTWNQILGAGCEAYVVTGVQTARLPSLVRVKKSHRVLARLQPLITAAQADLVPAPVTPPAASSAPSSS